MNELRTLSLNVPVQVLMLNQLMLATLDPETQRDFELITASRGDTTTTVQIFTFLESRCRAFKLHQTSQFLKAIPNILRSSQSARKKVSKSYSKRVTLLQSSLYNGSLRKFTYHKYFKMQANNTVTMRSNQDFVSTACKQLLGIKHVRSKCVVSVNRDIIPCCA